MESGRVFMALFFFFQGKKSGKRCVREQMTEELPRVHLTVRSASVYSLHSSKGTLRENRDKMKLHPEQKCFGRFFLGGGVLLRSPTECERDDGRKRQKRFWGSRSSADEGGSRGQVGGQCCGHSAGLDGAQKIEKGSLPPLADREPLLQLHADEKVEERGGGRAGGDSAEVCRGKRRRHLLVLCVLREAGGAQRSSVLHQNASDALHEPLGQREEREADVWVAASLGEETPVALSPFLWSHRRLAPRGARCRSAERGRPWFCCPRADRRAGGRGATSVLGAQGAVPLGAVAF